MSVIVPVYNGERFLSRSLRSVLDQTYSPLEIIAVDDGSTDSSTGLIASLSPAIRLIGLRNGGVARARQAGVLASRGEYVAFLDQDDWWLLDKVARQVQVLQDDPGVGLVHTAVQHYDEKSGEYVGKLNPWCAPERLSGACYDRLLMDNCIYNSSVLIRRSVFDRAGGFDMSIEGNTIADYDLWLKLAKLTRFAFVDDELTIFRIHGSQGTWKRREMLTAELKLLARHVSKADRQQKRLRGRFARLYESLGVACLDSQQHSAARRAFISSLREQLSIRRGMLLLASMLPPAMVGLGRRIKKRLAGHRL